MKEQHNDLPILTFESGTSLHAWLAENHAVSRGIRVRIYRKNSGIRSVTFEEMLDEGLCYGWSESMRERGDAVSYLQTFTPRRTKGTVSERNWQHARRLIAEGKMTPAGLRALGMESDTAGR
ncbi:MAG: hypothetical protein GX651_04440 [Methanomicrobiales archaeon]|nr:hypothetical protein [Methanomicrobiales archaeon]